MLLGAVVIFIAWLSLAPLGQLVWNAVWDGESFSISGLLDAYRAEGLGSVLASTVVYTVGTMLVAGTLGTVLAYLAARTDVPFKGLIMVSSLVPLIVPQVLYAVAWIYLASPRVGLINAWLEPMLGEGFFNVFSMAGMIMVEGLSLTPLIFLLMYASLSSMDPSLEESALMSGARRLTVLRRISLPMAAPAIYAGMLIAFIRGIESFEVPALIGLPEGIIVLMSRVWEALAVFPQDLETAGAYSIGLLVVTGIGVYLFQRMGARRGKSLQTVTGKGFRPHAMELGTWRRPLGAFVLAYFVIAVVLPFFILLYGSLQPYYTQPSWKSVTSPDFSRYGELFSQAITWRALGNSLFLAVVTATSVVLVMAVAAWLTQRSKIRGRRIVDFVAFLPLAAPGLVIGFAILEVYLNFPIPVYGTLWIIFIAYFTRFMPYGMQYVATSMAQIGSELEEAAEMSGARWWHVFRKIILPLILPGMVAGWVYVLCVSLRELASSLLLYSPGNEVLSVQIWVLWENGDFPGVACIGIVMIVVLVTIVLAARRFLRRFGMTQF